MWDYTYCELYVLKINFIGEVVLELVTSHTPSMLVKKVILDSDMISKA